MILVEKQKVFFSTWPKEKSNEKEIVFLKFGLRTFGLRWKGKVLAGKGLSRLIIMDPIVLDKCLGRIIAVYPNAFYPFTFAGAEWRGLTGRPRVGRRARWSVAVACSSASEVARRLRREPCYMLRSDSESSARPQWR